ncbi:glycosyl hydrolase family 16 [Maribacter vaceletii]|uniref:Glycosyl hydrolase family 16 n=1 Tax=Maribacter vaceletii TaxID=1206816 RepID=A0A495ECP0_9FLAO|nr:family 16 glycosylhydrolase [Maribacter vaceletii]RKR14566.1 glycosyl hydrolase family 16 [Maribacter vaceletii]
MKIYLIAFFAITGLFFSCSSSSENGEEEKKEVKDPVKDDDKDTIEPFELSDLDPNLPSFVSVIDKTPEGKKWEKVEEMSDEFDAWDEDKWFNSFWNYGNTPVWMREENSFVEDGKLCIKATLRDDPSNWFQTARVHSKTQISYPMYTECSMKTSSISAFNTFWLNNGDIDNRDEIDVVENNANPTPECSDQTTKPSNFPWTPWDFPTQMNSQYFIAKSGVTERHEDNFDTRMLSDANPNKDKTWDETYHIVGAWWKDARTVQFYLNGEEAGTVTTNQDFTRDLELIFDMWTSTECYLGGLPQKEELNNDSKNTMRVDWVRTWKLNDK